MRLALCTALALIGTLPAIARAQAPTHDFNDWSVLPLTEGPHPVALLGPGYPGLVVRGYVNNFNAHSYHSFTFYLSYPDSEGGQIRWDLIPFVAGSEIHRDFVTAQGADCVLRDLRLLRPKMQPPTAMAVLTAQRRMGESYADSQLVDFSLYQLRTSVTMAPGTPGIYFEKTRSLTSRRRYCDVEQAFKEEFGLGPGT
jgi:hypothetical protein